jgi:hypothetical protein
MKKKIIICSLVFMSVFLCAAINLSPAYSSSPIEKEILFADEAIPSWDEKYKDKPMIRLLEEHSFDLNEDFSFTEETHIVIKIQSEEGKKAGNITVNYDREKDVIEYLEAYTITPEGKRIECTQIEDRNAYEGYASISENRFKLLIMPQVSSGCMLEVKHRIFHKRPIIEKHFFQTFPFSSFAPIKIFRTKLMVPDNLELRFINHNTDISPSVDHEGNKVIYRWEIKGNEAELAEDNMPHWAEVFQLVSFSSLKSWAQLADLFWSLYSKNIIISPEMETKIEEITEKGDSLRGKIQSIIKYIQDEYRYLSMSIESHHYEPHPSNEVFINKYGDCKDQTVLAIAMLREIGVKAYPALFSYTFDPDFEKRLPMPSYFNHVILCIEHEGTKYYTDPQRKGFYFDETSYDLSGGYVLLLNGEGGLLERIPPAKPALYIDSSEYRVEINEDGSALFDGSKTFPRIPSIQVRSAYLNNTEEGRKKMLSSLDASLSSGGTMLSSTLNNIDDPYKNITIDARYRRTDFVKVANDMMMFGIGKLNTPVLASTERRYPIVFSGNYRYENRLDFIIPEDFEILNLPKNIHYDTEFATFSRTYEAAGRSIKVSDIYEIKMARLPPTAYEDVRKFFNNVSNSTNDTVVIKKGASPK